jgi:hypothetical protein
MKKLSDPVRRFVQAYGFEATDGSTLLIIATKMGPSSSSEDELLAQQTAGLSKQYETLAADGLSSGQPSKADVAVINGRRVVRFRATVGGDHVITRMVVFRRGNASFTVGLTITTSDPSRFDSVADSLAVP